ncbi:MAG TPA: substrate-binding domain-containing protein [Solirubrobacteraceae bacterium]|jgi:phosphate transport system substrate-binding protein|nr:substrate-binding domain-containing protein [Solirubrobacteraceae bacterium]
MICVGAAVMGVAATATAASASAAITEAGSSLVYPLVYKWSTVYTATKVSAAAGGSSAGIADISASSPSVNIGASDAPMTSSQYSGDSHTAVEIPWALSATDVVYNIPGIHAGLHLNASIIAGIFTGKITSWSSSAILKINKADAKALKKAPKITPVFRSDGSGDSFVFQNFMFRGAPKVWTITPSTAFPGTVGQGENGNYGVAGEVAKNAGAIGYVSAYYALSQHGEYPASVENAAGAFEQATGPTIEAAAKSNTKIPSQGSAFTAAGGVEIQYPAKKFKTAYPISTYTYAIVNKGESSISGLQAFLNWAVTTGQKYGPVLKFYALPSGIASQDQSLINGL